MKILLDHRERSSGIKKELIKQGAVDVNGKTASDPSLLIKKEDKIKVGSRTFLIAK